MRIFLLIVSLLLCSCAILPQGPSSVDAEAANRVANDFARSRLIADDFVSAMIQLPQLKPKATTLSTRIPGSRFGQLLMHAMQSAGYEFRVQISNDVDFEARVPTLAYFVSRQSAGDSPPGSLTGIYEFLIEAGTVKLKRSYKVGRNGVWPESSMFVLGADATGLQLDTRQFEQQRPAPTLAAGAMLASAAKDLLSENRSNNANVIDRSVEKTPVSKKAFTSPTRRVAATPIPAPRVGEITATARAGVSITKLPVKRNMVDLEQSNYAELLANYQTVERKILVFANDSMIMGDSNKRVAELIADNFNSDTDLISIVGCSHGSTSLRNGNALLANGRAARVKEEFLIAGIESELVLDEGCWAGTSYKKMPARGVVVTHKRRS